MIVLDTDYFSLLLRKDSTEGEEINRRLDLVEDDIVTTIMTAEEQMRGWLAAIRRIRDARKQIPGYASLQRMFEFLADWNILSWDDDAVDIFKDLQKRKTRIGTMDLKIASIVLAHDATLLSRNLGDFERVPGLRVEDWLD